MSTDGIERALELAKESAGGRNVRLWAGPRPSSSTWRRGSGTELELHVVPLLLRDGARLLDRLADAGIALEQVRAVEAPGVTHVKYRELS